MCQKPRNCRSEGESFSECCENKIENVMTNESNRTEDYDNTIPSAPSDSESEGTTDYDTEASFKVIKTKKKKGSRCSKKVKKAKSNSDSERSCTRSSKSERFSGKTRRSKILPLPKKRIAKLEISSQQGYLGILTRHDAETAMGSKTRFAVYHQLGYPPVLINMQTEITLSAVYKSSNGSFSHFSIREHVRDDISKQYYVDSGKSKQPVMFPSIEKMMDYYCKIRH